MGSILEYEATTLDSIAASTLVLTGADSSKFFEDEAAVLVARIPEAHHEQIADAGHGAHMDNPKAFNEKVRTFLRDVFNGIEQSATN